MENEQSQRLKSFLCDNRELLILGIQLTLVAVVCFVGIRNDLDLCSCNGKKKRRNKR